MNLIISKFETFLYYLFLLITILLFPLIFFFIKLIDVFYKIRFTEILSNRYGHLALNPEYYLVEKKEYDKKKKYLDLFCRSRHGICNKELWNLWKKKIIILPRFLIGPIIVIFNKIYKSQNPHTIANFNQTARNLNFSWDKYKPSIDLTKEQKEKCKKILLDNNIQIDKISFVCLFNRDDAYLKSPKKNWYYLSHHNYKIEKFNLMADELTKRNIYVFRMGAKVEGKFGKKNEKIIDYANSSFRSELMDIFLASNCFFGIECGTGSIGVAYLFRKPIVSLNANIFHLYTGVKNGVMLSKHYFCKIRKRNLTLGELMKFEIGDLDHRQQLDDANIDVIDCTNDEIRDACIELLERLQGTWKDTPVDIELQKKFKEKYDNFKVYKKTGLRWHGDLIRSKYSSKFLRDNVEWLQ
jgi:putative glycosyltransferase (TIGR04372 family)